MSVSVKRRVIHLVGYDPLTPEVVHARFARELRRFGPCWGAQAAAGPATVADKDARWTIEASGPDWRAETEHILLRWDDVIAAQRARPSIARWPLGALSFLDFVAGGALAGYGRHGPRYILFFLYPFVLMALCIAAGWIAGAMLSGWGWPVAAAAGLAIAAGLLLLAERKAHLGHLLDDWIYASDLVRREHPVVAGRIAHGVRLIAETPRDVELLVVGHSLGAVLAAEMLAKSIAADPDGRPIGFLTLGSSILKIALHRGASRLRDAVAAIAASDRVAWADYSAVNDVMNFFKTDTVKALKLEGRSPVVRKASFAKMLKPDYYRSIRTNFFRLHNQFVSGNDLRAPYDYMMTVAGPFPLMALAASETGAVGWLDETGALTDMGRAAADQPIAQRG